MLPLIRKSAYLPHRENDFFGKDLLSTVFNDGADYSVPAVNIKENENNFEIELAAPGLSKKDFSINLEKKILTVSSEREVNNESENKNYMRKEFGYTSFKRSFKLPETVNTEKIKASFKNGILNIELPKMDEAKVKQTKSIAIS
ncbi:MAG: hypothetical protein B6D61_08610 [Bacteroidetes bacterium 4484_249]|nr:MAG: hypothetical protein B6D61_08610 [Bacteroidetes bacterium 4484_249]